MVSEGGTSEELRTDPRDLAGNFKLGGPAYFFLSGGGWVFFKKHCFPKVVMKIFILKLMKLVKVA